MASERCFIDTNVPMYAAGAEHRLKAPCAALLRAVASGEVEAASSVEVMQELLHRYSAMGKRDLAVSMVTFFMEVVSEVLPVTSEDIVAALAVHGSNPDLQTRDVMHVVTMRRHGIRTIVSADRHFDGVEGIRRVDPIDWTVLRES